jgi:hypothetical protein
MKQTKPAQAMELRSLSPVFDGPYDERRMTSDGMRQRLEHRSDEELLEILRRHDTNEWQPSVFPLAEDILRGRGVDVAQALASVPASDPSSDEDPLVPIAGFATVVESEACRSALLAAGFHVAGADQFLLQVDPALGPALGGFSLAVPASEADDARSFLAAAEGGELSAGLAACSACGSTDVISERTVSRSGTFMNTFLVGPVVPDVTVTFRCRGCGATWQ